MLERFYLAFGQGLILLIALFGGALSVSAQRVALLPMADYSRGLDGINLPFTREVEKALTDLGVEMVQHEHVLRFMAENRLRSFSYLDSFLVQKMGKDLKCAVALIGTVTEIGGRKPVLGLTFTAMDTVSGSPVWSETGATGIAEQARFLAIGEPQTVQDLAAPLLGKLLGHLGGTVEAGAIPNERSYQLAGMQLFPAYVRGREKIEATLKIRFLHAEPTMVAVESNQRRTYLEQDPQTGIYQGRWWAPQQDGLYPLDLILEWGAGRFVERVENISSFQVINQPPGLEIKVKKALQLDNQQAFRSHILILPKILDIKPMARWALDIRTAEGVLLTTQEYEGDMPERMVWEGRGGEGYLLSDGKYEITLHVWDLAGNHSSDSFMVVMQRHAPQIKAEILTRQGKKLLQVASLPGPVFLFESWSLELLSEHGESLLQQNGRDLPLVLEFVPVAGEEKLFLNFTGEDRLGNRLEQVHMEITVPELKPMKKVPQVDSWVQDF